MQGHTQGKPKSKPAYVLEYDIRVLIFYHDVHILCDYSFNTFVCCVKVMCTYVNGHGWCKGFHMVSWCVEKQVI